MGSLHLACMRSEDVFLTGFGNPTFMRIKYKRKISRLSHGKTLEGFA